MLYVFGLLLGPAHIAVCVCVCVALFVFDDDGNVQECTVHILGGGAPAAPRYSVAFCARPGWAAINRVRVCARRLERSVLIDINKS